MQVGRTMPSNTLIAHYGQIHAPTSCFVSYPHFLMQSLGLAGAA